MSFYPVFKEQVLNAHHIVDEPSKLNAKRQVEEDFLLHSVKIP